MESKIHVLTLLALACLILPGLTIHSNLTLLHEETLNITEGFQLIEVRFNYVYLYALTANDTHFQVAKCLWPSVFNCYDWSQ